MRRIPILMLVGLVCGLLVGFVVVFKFLLPYFVR